MGQDVFGPTVANPVAAAAQAHNAKVAESAGLPLHAVEVVADKILAGSRKADDTSKAIAAVSAASQPPARPAATETTPEDDVSVDIGKLLGEAMYNVKMAAIEEEKRDKDGDSLMLEDEGQFLFDVCTFARPDKAS